METDNRELKMRLSKFFIFHFSLLLGLSAFAVRSPGFSMGAFNLAVPSSSRNAVFSPFAFEIDAVIVSEAFGPLEKAKYVETLGALVGYENVYKPLLARYSDATTNGFTLVSSRGYLTVSLDFLSPKYRIAIQNDYGAQTCPVKPHADGAESYFRASMDGEMEGFMVPAEALAAKSVSFMDLESFRCHWQEPFPTANTRQIAFTAEDGTRSEVTAIADVRAAELWETSKFTMLRLPMTDGSFFFAVLPSAENNLASIRGEFAAEKLEFALVVLRSITETGVYHGNVAVVLPKLDLDHTSDLMPVFQALELPLGGFKDIHLGGQPLALLRQRARFRLDESGPKGAFIERKRPQEEKHADDRRRFIANRPFLFFVYHEPTRSIPVAGVFAGGNQ